MRLVFLYAIQNLYNDSRRRAFSRLLFGRFIFLPDSAQQEDEEYHRRQKRERIQGQRRLISCLWGLAATGGIRATGDWLCRFRLHCTRLLRIGNHRIGAVRSRPVGVRLARIWFARIGFARIGFIRTGVTWPAAARIRADISCDRYVGIGSGKGGRSKLRCQKHCHDHRRCNCADGSVFFHMPPPFAKRADKSAWNLQGEVQNHAISRL